ncbi:MAG: topoisomerase DNA-binding C4 zinc finger domain-containing protein, partial [Dehalococcoidia bacterium]
KDRGTFYPTGLGTTVNALLKEHFPDIVDLGFTAEMEQELDEIARGERGWVPVVRDFYGPFQDSITRASDAIPDEAAGMGCELCGRPMVVRAGRRGRFIACSGYPECKNTKPIPRSEAETEAPEETDETCDKCSQPMVVKTGRRGKFIACTGFPKCKNTKPYLIKAGAVCPDCGGDLVEKRSKKGRTFFGCASYPTCNFAVNQRPLPQSCLNCGGLLVESGRDGARCIRCKNRYKIEELAPEKEATPKEEVTVG